MRPSTARAVNARNGPCPLSESLYPLAAERARGGSRAVDRDAADLGQAGRRRRRPPRGALERGADGAARAALSSMLLVLETDNAPRVRDGYIRLSTRGHARARMVRRGSTVRVRQRALAYCLLSALFRCRSGRRSATATSIGRPKLGRRRLGRPRSRRGAGLRARVRRKQGSRNDGQSWSGWLPCSAKGRTLKCRHGARRSRRCGGDRGCADVGTTTNMPTCLVMPTLAGESAQIGLIAA